MEASARDGRSGAETDVPVAGQPSARQSSTDQSSTDQSSTDQSSTDQSSTDQPSTDQPSTDQPSTDQPSTDQPSAAQSSAAQSSAGQPSGAPADDLGGAADPAALVPDPGPAPEPSAADILGPDPAIAGLVIPELPDEDAADPDEHELRPERRLRVWQVAPIVVLGVLGSLMFAFPLAFEFSDGGPVVAMLGLLICAATAGWTIMVARWVGYVWPGLPERGSGGWPDWRYVLGYVCLGAVVAVVAVIRLARLR